MRTSWRHGAGLCWRPASTASLGESDVDVAGWLEGSVDVSTESGSVSVKTVKGMLTRLHAVLDDLSPIESELLKEQRTELQVRI